MNYGYVCKMTKEVLAWHPMKRAFHVRSLNLDTLLDTLPPLCIINTHLECTRYLPTHSPRCMRIHWKASD